MLQYQYIPRQNREICNLEKYKKNKAGQKLMPSIVVRPGQLKIELKITEIAILILVIVKNGHYQVLDWILQKLI